MNTDPIADMLTRIRNAIMARRDSINLPHSKTKEAIAGILRSNNFIAGYRVDDSGPFRALVININPEGETPYIQAIDRISKPGRRIYAKSQEIPNIMSGRGIVIISTSSGIMTGKEAKKRGLGGELICKVW
jgi:small subunit ribosomal protein S8